MRVSILTKMYVTHLINLEGGGFSPLSPPPGSDPDLQAQHSQSY